MTISYEVHNTAGQAFYCKDAVVLSHNGVPCVTLMEAVDRHSLFNGSFSYMKTIRVLGDVTSIFELPLPLEIEVVGK